MLILGDPALAFGCNKPENSSDSWPAGAGVVPWASRSAIFNCFCWGDLQGIATSGMHSLSDVLVPDVPLALHSRQRLLVLLLVKRLDNCKE